MPIRFRTFSNFFKHKTIQRTDKFLVTIIENIPQSVFLSKKYKQVREELLNRSGPMPELRDYQVVNVSIPNFEFKKEIVNEGIFPFSFPVLEHNGFEISVLFEDDAFGTIPNFVNWCQRRILNNDGIYYPPSMSRIGNMKFEAFNDENSLIYEYEFRNIYFLRATPMTFDYTQATGQKISITFGCDDNVFSIND